MKIGLWSILKFFLALMLLPAVIAITVSFHEELTLLKSLQQMFYCGIMAYVIMHLFLFTPVGFFQFWQKIFGEIFKFSSVASSIIPMAVPLLTVVILLVFYLIKPAIKIHDFDRQVMMAVGFTMAMHIVLIAHQLYDEDNNGIKPNYLFAMGLIYMVNVCLLAVLLDLNFDKFSSTEFFRSFWKLLDKTYQVLYHKFLLLKK